MVIQQVVNFAPVNFIHRNCYCEIPLSILPVMDSTVEKVSDCQLLQPLHRECFSGSGLPIRKNGDSASVEDVVEDRFDGAII